MVAMAKESVQRRMQGSDMGDFHEELWARFGPTKFEDFDEALSKVKQLGSLRDY